jgi:hypothetical protein
VVRPKLARLIQMTLGMLMLILAVGSYQNCTGYEATYNPLFDRDEPSLCYGVACSMDASTAEIDISRMPSPTQISTLPQGSTQPSFCDPSTCFDVAGYCDTGGYPNTAFYHQFADHNGVITRSWSKIDGAYCDGMGRFYFRVQVPMGFAYEYESSLTIKMSLIDSNKQEVEANGKSIKTIKVKAFAPPPLQ